MALRFTASMQHMFLTVWQRGLDPNLQLTFTHRITEQGAKGKFGRPCKRTSRKAWNLRNENQMLVSHSEVWVVGAQAFSPFVLFSSVDNEGSIPGPHAPRLSQPPGKLLGNKGAMDWNPWKQETKQWTKTLIRRAQLPEENEHNTDLV